MGNIQPVRMHIVVDDEVVAELGARVGPGGRSRYIV